MLQMQQSRAYQSRLSTSSIQDEESPSQQGNESHLE